MHGAAAAETSSNEPSRGALAPPVGSPAQESGAVMQLRITAASALFLWNSYCFAGNCDSQVAKTKADSYDSIKPTGAAITCDSIHRYIAFVKRMLVEFEYFENCAQTSWQSIYSAAE